MNGTGNQAEHPLKKVPAQFPERRYGTFVSSQA
jgi:hypothetical protein